jgi:hypothetical protein
MKRTATFILALLCIALATHTRAQASMFCPADVAFMTPWDLATDTPSANDASSHYAFNLEGDNPGLLSGELILVTDTKAYTAAFDRVQLVRSLEHPNEFASDGSFIQLPAKEAVRYAWVDNVTDAAGKHTDCPTFPYEVPKLSAQERTELTPANPQPPKGAFAFNGLVAKFKMDLPPLGCAKPYGVTSPLADISQTYDFYDPSVVNSPVVEGRVDIDSSGKPLAVEITKSSGVVAFDAYVREWHGSNTYRPAIFRCVPVVSSYYFQVEYSRR